ncbi:glucose uptake inhibitor SgrT [Candidatus Fukatsuia symbiotica]|nr:glucose uptake inhibitor SgrT [Candidatus Fukatsuia symbiotica]MEA9445762.1 glucose uptake inhibitor SgrT [Candidatus Fukatsuia symbiotica]
MQAYLSREFYQRYFSAIQDADWLPWVSTQWRLQTLAQLIQWNASQLSNPKYSQKR